MDVKNILSGYDKNNITIAVLGSHSALDVCRGAKDESFRTLVVCQKGREKTYTQHFRSNAREGVVDEVIVLERFKDILNKEVLQKLREKNVIFIPHRSFEVYLDFDYDAIEQDFKVPIFGTRHLLRAEERTSPNNQYDLLRKAGIRMPRIFQDPNDIDRVSIVKLPEKARKFERAFFFCSSAQEYKEKLKERIKSGEIEESRVSEAVIEEFIIGPLVNFNYFYSPLRERVELLGTDSRRQTNMDGLLRLPAGEQIALQDKLRPKFEEAGHYAVTVLESMLEHAFRIGEMFADITKKEFPPGIIGPFALQSAITPGPPRKEIVVFDVSLRVQGSPGTRFTPYTAYLYGEDISTGHRAAMEIKEALQDDRLIEIVT